MALQWIIQIVHYEENHTKEKEKRQKETWRTKAALYQKYIFEHYQADYPFNKSSFVNHLSPIHIKQKQDKMH